MIILYKILFISFLLFGVSESALVQLTNVTHESLYNFSLVQGYDFFSLGDYYAFELKNYEDPAPLGYSSTIFVGKAQGEPQPVLIKKVDLSPEFGWKNNLIYLQHNGTNTYSLNKFNVVNNVTTHLMNFAFTNNGIIFPVVCMVGDLFIYRSTSPSVGVYSFNLASADTKGSLLFEISNTAQFSCKTVVNSILVHSTNTWLVKSDGSVKLMKENSKSFLTDVISDGVTSFAINSSYTGITYIGPQGQYQVNATFKIRDYGVPPFGSLNGNLLFFNGSAFILNFYKMVPSTGEVTLLLQKWAIAGTPDLPSLFYNDQNFFYFSFVMTIATSNSVQKKVWRTDGTVTGTIELYSGSSFYAPYFEGGACGNTFFYMSSTSDLITWVYVTDGYKSQLIMTSNHVREKSVKYADNAAIIISRPALGYDYQFYSWDFEKCQPFSTSSSTSQSSSSSSSASSASSPQTTSSSQTSSSLSTSLSPSSSSSSSSSTTSSFSPSLSSSTTSASATGLPDNNNNDSSAAFTSISFSISLIVSLLVLFLVFY